VTTHLAETLIALAWIALAPCPSAFALNPTLDIGQYVHTAWKVDDGFTEGDITSIAQTPDGYLWLGTGFGLFRFDGVRAVPWQPPAGERIPTDQIWSLLTARDGTLWIGTSDGLVSWKGGSLTRYADLAGATVRRLLEDRDGTIWIGTLGPPNGKLCAIRDGRIRCFGADRGFGRGVYGLYEDTHHRLWVGTLTGVWQWSPGPPVFHELAGENGIQGLDEGDDGALLIAAHDGLRRLVDGRIDAFPLAGAPEFRARTLHRDRDGSLWIGTFDVGLVHLHQGRVDVFGQKHGLSGDWNRAVFEDREGTVWAATANGLDRFRESAIATFSINQGLSTGRVDAVAAARDGSVWMATTEGLNRLDKGHVIAYPDVPKVVRSVYQDGNGRTWLSTDESFGYLENGRLVRVSAVPAGVIRSIAEGDDGSLWLQHQNLGLYHLSERDFEHFSAEMLGRQDYAIAMAWDRFKGGLWLGYRGGGVAFFAGGQVRASYAAVDGLGAGRVADLRIDHDGALWAATEGGLSRVKDGGITTLTRANGLPCNTVHWSIEDDAHSVWLYMDCGLVSLPRLEVDAWTTAVDGRRDTRRQVDATVYDSSDGVRRRSQPGGLGPRVGKSPDGRIWFTGVEGVNVVDPGRLPVNHLTPPVHIEQVGADRRTYGLMSDAATVVRLPALTRDLQIDYTALSLVAPEKNQIRYKLEGYDRDWQDVGNRRQAYYTNLPPRNYRFRVIASNNSGVWNETGASLDFSIAPAYYQTTLFRSAVVLSFIALLWAAYQYRVRQVAAAFDARLQERVNERTRIARELHDTLLQSFHGLLFRFQAATNRLPASDVKQQFESAIDQAAHAIAEGRDAVQNLRASTTVTNDLAEALTSLADELCAVHAPDAGAKPPSVRIAVEGESKELHPIVRDDVYRIAGEALRNACRHAHARHIEVAIRYDDTQLGVRIRDDGRGIEPAVRDDDRPGHFGLPGMRERAELIGGRLEVWSEVGLGTEVELTIPAAAAYATARTRRFPRVFSRTGVVLVLALLSSSEAFALNTALDVSQYVHSAWRTREGFANGSISALAQTSDGYLWIGTEFGLLRFDGVRNVPWQPPAGQALPSTQITALRGARDGTLWIGTSSGLARWDGRRLTRYDGFGRVMNLLEDREGVMWSTDYHPPRSRLCAIRQAAVDCATPATGQTFEPYALFEDRNGTIWTGTRNGVWRWKPGPPTFYSRVEDQNGIQGMADGDNGALLMSVRGEVSRLVDGRVETAFRFPEAEQRFQALRMLRDRDGGLWVGTLGGGLVHAHRGRTDVYARAEGLSNDNVRAIYEDREGTVWVVTEGGLDRFRESIVGSLSTEQGLSNDAVISVSAAKDGGVWIGTREGLNRWTNGDVRQIPASGFPGHGVQAMFEDSRGRLWIGSSRGLGYLDRDRYIPVGPSYDRLNFYAITEDSHGVMWAANLEHGLVRVDPQGGFREFPLATLGRGGDRISTLVADRKNGGMWIGFERGGIVYWADDRIQTGYRAADGLGRGVVSALNLDEDATLWVATEGGLTRLVGSRPTTITAAHGLPCEDLQWVIEDEARAFWMEGSCGVMRVSRAELEETAAAVENGERATGIIHAALFGSVDGVRRTTSAGFYGPHVAKAADGRIWFSGFDGVSVVDPARLPVNTLPPPVHVERFVANRGDLQVDYTALSLVAPENVRFRYTLEGYDRGWQEAGARRQAFYTNLAPGTYRFRVRASNNSGIWNETGAAVDVSIVPAYYQKVWFRTLAVLGTLALLWAGYQYRLRRVAHEYEARLQERVNERTRIARELHDTLLQGFHGLLFRFQAVSNLLPARPVDAKRQLDSAIDQVAQAITEGRDAVQNLRASTTVTNDLAEALGALAGELAAAARDESTSPPVVDLEVEGETRDLHPIVRDDVYRIAGEALRNAFRHAHARHIEVAIRYDPQQLQVRVRDDGAGIDRTPAETSRDGHFGLPGMRERAELIGGQLVVWSEPGLGTEVELTIPAAAAYGAPRASNSKGLRYWIGTKRSVHS
jgi:signal transduction histidine kinase/ligand-binding sensor domain-containing protein